MEQLVERAYETFARAGARRGRSTTASTCSARPVIVSDGDRVLQIVDNLLSNAFRATPDGGRIALELDAGERHGARRGRGHGPGHRADEQRERLFRAVRLRTAAAPASGSTIARELSVALGGRIELESEVGRGSRFELVLPA